MNGTIKYTIPNNCPVPVGDTKGAEAIAAWLISEIQYSIRAIDDIESMILAVSQGQIPDGYQGTGNAFSLCATKNCVLLESEYSDSHVVCISADQIVAVLEQYRQFLVCDYRIPGGAPPAFTVEYLAEQKESKSYYIQIGGVFIHPL
jgi:hypothetical protein